MKQTNKQTNKQTHPETGPANFVSKMVQLRTAAGRCTAKIYRAESESDIQHNNLFYEICHKYQHTFESWVLGERFRKRSKHFRK